MNLLSETLAKWKALSDSEREQMKQDALSKKQIEFEDAISFMCLVDDCLMHGLKIEKNDLIHNKCIDLIIRASGKQL